MALIANVIGIISSAITMVGSTPFLTSGRLLLGIAAGLYNVIFGKVIVENMPAKLAQKLSLLHNWSCGTGFFIVYSMGVILPDSKDLTGNEADEFWRVIYLMPTLIGIIEIILLTLVFRQEPIAFCITMGLEEQGKEHMNRVYRKTNPDSKETIEEILER